MEKYSLNDFSQGKAFISNEKGTYCINVKGEKLFELSPDIKCTTYTEEDIAIVEKNGEYAVLNNHGNFLTTFAYSSIDEYSHVVERHGKYGCIDIITGQSVLPCMYDDGMFYFEDGYAVVEYRNKAGVVDNRKNKLIPFEYDTLTYAGHNLFAASKDSKYGIINYKKRQMCKFKYDELFPIGSDDCLFIAVIMEKYGLIDCNGNEVVHIEYEDAKPFARTNEFVSFGMSGKYGIYSISRREFITEIIYEDVCYCDDGNYFIVRKDGQTFFVDSCGEQIDFPLFYPDDYRRECTLHNTFFEGVRPVSDGKYVGVINRQGELVIPYQYKSVRFSNEGLMAVVDKNNKEGYIDRKGITRISFGKYHDCKDFHCGVAKVKTNKDEEVYIDKSGEIISLLKTLT